MSAKFKSGLYNSYLPVVSRRFLAQSVTNLLTYHYKFKGRLTKDVAINYNILLGPAQDVVHSP